MCLCESLRFLSLWGAHTHHHSCFIKSRSCRSLLGSQIRQRQLNARLARVSSARQPPQASSNSDTDPGAWEFSPEWMGSQGGSWGRDAGTTVFSQLSHCGNGLVTVTSHAASHQEPPLAERLQRGAEGGMLQEWRVLRFNEITRQSVARVWQPADGSSGALAQADCLGMEYLKTMASAGESDCKLQVLSHACGGHFVSWHPESHQSHLGHVLFLQQP